MQATQTVEKEVITFPGDPLLIDRDNGTQIEWPIKGRETMDDYGEQAFGIIAEAAKIPTRGRSGLDAAIVLAEIAGNECASRLAGEDILKMLVDANNSIKSNSVMGEVAGYIAEIAEAFLARPNIT